MIRVASLIAVASLAPAQVATEANRNYENPEGRERMIQALSSPDRAKRLRVEQLVKNLELKPGDTVADLGTGAGVLLPYLSKQVAGSGVVIAQDIHEDFLAAARSMAEEEKLENVRFVVGREKNPKLPVAAVDVALAVDTYHHFNYPGPMLNGIRTSLKPGGRFVIVDYYKESYRDPPHIRIDKADVIKEVEAGGFVLAQDIEHVPGAQYMLVFKKKPAK